MIFWSCRRTWHR